MSGARTASVISRRSVRRCVRSAEGSRRVGGVRPRAHVQHSKKMQRKQLAFEQLLTCARTLVVASIPDCYAALGVVTGFGLTSPGIHDYIALPRQRYRSIHTAVIARRQERGGAIRTRECTSTPSSCRAHWTYKEASAGSQYQRKIDGLLGSSSRRMAPSRSGPDSDRDSSSACAPSCSGSLYASLQRRSDRSAAGATPLDFATASTPRCHRCRGAKVNAAIVPLVTRSPTVRSGDHHRETGRTEPHWMPRQGYLVSAAIGKSRLVETDCGTSAAPPAIALTDLARAGAPEQSPLGKLRPATRHLYQLL